MRCSISASQPKTSIGVGDGFGASAITGSGEIAVTASTTGNGAATISKADSNDAFSLTGGPPTVVHASATAEIGVAGTRSSATASDNSGVTDIGSSRGATGSDETVIGGAAPAEVGGAGDTATTTGSGLG